MIYFTADLHFGHDACIEYCNRPFKNASVMDRQLIKNWNSVVEDEDTVYVVGDFTLKAPIHKNYIENIVSKLKGSKHLILGNHDRLKPFDYVNDIGFFSVHTSLEVYGYILNHDPAVACMDFKRTFLCGHVHNLFRTQKNVINVGVDVCNFKPISILDIQVITTTL